MITMLDDNALDNKTLDNKCCDCTA